MQLHPNKWFLRAKMNKRGSIMSNVLKDALVGHKSQAMNPRDNDIKREENICIHIFSVSAGMVGVCLTVIGLIRVVITLGRADTLADDFLAGDAVLFLTASLMSYAALRTHGARRIRQLERWADWIFILAMTVMVAICAFIAYAISIPPPIK